MIWLDARDLRQTMSITACVAIVSVIDSKYGNAMLSAIACLLDAIFFSLAGLTVLAGEWGFGRGGGGRAETPPPSWVPESSSPPDSVA